MKSCFFLCGKNVIFHSCQDFVHSQTFYTIQWSPYTFSYLNVPAFKETESVEVSLLALHHMKSFSHNKQNKNAPTSQDLRLCYACSIVIYCYMQPLLVFINIFHMMYLAHTHYYSNESYTWLLRGQISKQLPNRPHSSQNKICRHNIKLMYQTFLLQKAVCT